MPACPRKQRTGDSFGVGLGPTRQFAINAARDMADGIGLTKARQALAALPKCDAGCVEDSTAAGAEGPTQVRFAVRVMNFLWIAVVRRFWRATRFCKPAPMAKRAKARRRKPAKRQSRRR